MAFGLSGSWIRRIDGHLDAAPRGGGGALGGRLEAAPHLLEVDLVERAQVEVGGGVLGNDVGLLAADRDDAVDPRVRAELLAHRVERVEEPDDRVQRVDAPPRPGRRVGGLAEVLDLGLHEPERRPPDLRPAARVDHHRGVDVAEDAGVQELDLARAAFLRGRPHHRDPAREGEARPGEARRDDGERRAGAGARRRDDVVAARVADAGERVVLGHHRDRRAVPGSGHLGAKRGRQAAHAALDAASLALEELGQPGGRLLLLEGQLRDGRGSGARGSTGPRPSDRRPRSRAS